VSALEEAIQVQRSPHTLYDGPTLRRIIGQQLIITERKEHARELAQRESV